MSRPTEQDRQNAALRASIAAKQKAEYDEAVAVATEAWEIGRSGFAVASFRTPLSLRSLRD